MGTDWSSGGGPGIPPPPDAWSGGGQPWGGQPGWQQPSVYAQGSGWYGYGAPPAPRSNGVAVAAMVLGIIAVAFGIIPFLFFVAIPVGLAAIVCGAIGLARVRELQLGKGQSITGLVTGGVGIVVSILWLVGIFAFGAAVVNELEGVTVSGTCRGGTNARSHERVEQVDGLRISDIVVCEDFADDFALSAAVTNEGSAASANLTVRFYDGERLLGDANRFVNIPAGGSAQVYLTGFSDYDGSWDRIVFRLER